MFRTASNFSSESFVILLPLGIGEVLQLVGEARLLILGRRDSVPKGCDFISGETVVEWTTKPVDESSEGDSRAFARQR